MYKEKSMNEVYVPYGFSVKKGTKITTDYYKKGKDLYGKTIEFCKNNLSENKYEVEKFVYAKGIKVKCKYKKDVKKIQQWIQQ
jgi:hypothetical protein